MTNHIPTAMRPGRRRRYGGFKTRRREEDHVMFKRKEFKDAMPSWTIGECRLT